MSDMPTRDMIEYAGRDRALEYHVFHRHYPPPPWFMLELARWAVDGFDGDNWDEEAPAWSHDRVSDRHGNPLTRGALIEGMHLYAFVQDPEEV